MTSEQIQIETMEKNFRPVIPFATLDSTNEYLHDQEYLLLLKYRYRAMVAMSFFKVKIKRNDIIIEDYPFDVEFIAKRDFCCMKNCVWCGRKLFGDYGNRDSILTYTHQIVCLSKLMEKSIQRIDNKYITKKDIKYKEELAVMRLLNGIYPTKQIPTSITPHEIFLNRSLLYQCIEVKKRNIIGLKDASSNDYGLALGLWLNYKSYSGLETLNHMPLPEWLTSDSGCNRIWDKFMWNYFYKEKESKILFNNEIKFNPSLNFEPKYHLSYFYKNDLVWIHFAVKLSMWNTFVDFIKLFKDQGHVLPYTCDCESCTEEEAECCSKKIKDLCNCSHHRHLIFVTTRNIKFILPKIQDMNNLGCKKVKLQNPYNVGRQNTCKYIFFDILTKPEDLVDAITSVSHVSNRIHKCAFTTQMYKSQEDDNIFNEYFRRVNISEPFTYNMKFVAMSLLPDGLTRYAKDFYKNINPMDLNEHYQTSDGLDWPLRYNHDNEIEYFVLEKDNERLPIYLNLNVDQQFGRMVHIQEIYKNPKLKSFVFIAPKIAFEVIKNENLRNLVGADSWRIYQFFNGNLFLENMAAKLFEINRRHHAVIKTSRFAYKKIQKLIHEKKAEIGNLSI